MIRPIRDRTTFVELRRHGRRARRGPITVTWLQDVADAPPRVAFAVSRRVGNAVVRNRVRRRLRSIVAALAASEPSVVAPGAYLLSTQPSVVTLSFEELTKTVAAAIGALQGPLPPTGGQR